MTDLADLDVAAAAATEAQRQLEVTGKAVLKQALTEVFSNPSIETVAWAQKHSEYNDEGLYPGITGPVINVVDADDPTADLWDWAGYGDSSPGEFPEEQRLVKSVLDKIGEETICEIVGDDDNIVVASRQGDGFTIFAEYAGY